MLEICSLSVDYGTRPALRELSLSIRRGEILAVIGPNGAGKSTLIRAVSGVVPIRAGKVFIQDQDVSRLPPMLRARHIAVVPQARQLPAAFTVYQVVFLGRTPYLGWLGSAGPTDHAHVRLAMEQTQTLELADRRIGELSGGEQQRVLLARALAQNAPVLLLDEPVTHLDLQHQALFLQLVKELATQQDLAVLLVLHDLNMVGLHADRVALLVEGQLGALGAPSEVLREDLLSAVYDLPISVVPHPVYGSPLVLPDGKHNPSLPSSAGAERNAGQETSKLEKIG